MRFAWPLTGRSEEMRTIDAAISAPDSSGIVVCGAPGVGKSRMAREALAAAEAAGYVTRWAIGSAPARALPLGAFAPWVEPTASDGAQLVQLVRSVVRELTLAPPNKSVVVGVDDVHLLDDLSTFVLHQIVQRGAAKVVLTLRAGELITPGVQEIWKIGRLGRLDLQPLSRDETTILVSEALKGPIDPDAAHRLWKLTQGNALYLRNIVEHEVSDGRVARHNGRWRWTGDPVVPPGLVDLIESRIGGLPESVRDVVDLLAVGEPLTLSSLMKLTSPSAVEEADTHGLISLDEVDGRMEARVAHPLYGEVRRKRAASTRLRRLRGLLTAELAATNDNHDIRLLVRRATLSLDSDLDPDPSLLLKAAEGAMWLADTPLADRLAQAAITAGAGPDAYLIRSFALAWQGRGEEADAVVASTPTEGLTDAERVYLAGHRGFNTLWGLADPQAAKKLFDDAARFATASTRSWVDAYMTTYWVSMAQLEKARRAGKRVDIGQLPEIIGSAAAWALVVAYGDAGHTTKAAALAEVGYGHVTRTAGAPHMRLLIVDKHVGVLLQAGRIAEACVLAERARDQSADLPGVAQLLSAGIAGRAFLSAGRVDEARSLLEPVVELFTGDANGFQYRFLIPLTTALAMAGMTERAADTVSLQEEVFHRSWRFLDYERALAHAWVAAAQGAVRAAIGEALSGAETARANGQFAAEVMCLQTATQFGDGSHAVRLRELENIVEGPRAGLAARFAAALFDGDASGLSSVSEEFENIGDLIAAMDAAAHAALAHRRADRKGSSLTCSARAEELAHRCGGASSPALRKASERLPLSDREREITMLIGLGLSNGAIAERLTLSVRTVEGHIYRAMGKTGAADREELAAMLPRANPDARSTHESKNIR